MTASSPLSSTASIASGAGVLSSPGIGSGLNVSSIVSQLMAVEQMPVTALQKQVTKDQSKITAFGQINSSLTAFQSAVATLASSSGFQSYTATPSNTAVLSATAASGALTGSHNITVTSLAASQIQAAATGYTSTSTVLGLSGTLNFSSGSSTAAVTVAASDTLADIQAKINAASGNTFASASIVNDGSTNPYKLVISASNSGTAGAVSVTDSLSTPFAFAQSQAAADAKLSVDGINITSASNTVTSAISGVTLSLSATGSTSLGVSLNTSAVTTNVQALVTTYNTLFQQINTLRATGGTLQSDGTLLSLQNGLKNVFNAAASVSGSSLKYLTQVGVTFQKDGTLTLDSAALNTALTNNYNNVVSLFSDSTQGFGTRLKTFATNFLNPLNGSLASTTTSLNKQIDNLNSSIAHKNANLVLVQATYQAQFTALDTLMSSMTNTSSFLTQQFAALTKSTA